MNKKVLAVAITSALAVPLAANAMSYKISGHVNRAISFIDDGDTSDIKHTDNTASRTRLRIKGSEKLGNGWSAGFYIENGIASNFDSGVTINPHGADNGGDDAFGIRHSMIYFKGGFGTFNFGHTSAADDGTAFQDMSGTWMATEAAMGEHLSSIAFRTTGAAHASTGVTGSGYGVFDGGRYDLMRYDSPKFGPFQLKASWGNGSKLALGGFLSTDLAGGKFGASIGYEDLSVHGGAREQISGSASFMFSQGTNITVAASQRDFDATGRDNADNWYVKLGHKFGPHAVSIDYGQFNDITAAGHDGDGWGLGWGYSGFSKAGVDIYAGYRHLELDTPTGAASAEDIDSFLIGSRIKFN